MRAGPADAVAAVLKALFAAIAWNFVPSNPGRGVLLRMTAGRRPRGRSPDRHGCRIRMTGVAVPVVAWFAVAFYNPFHTGHVFR